MKNKFKLLSLLLIANGVYAQQPQTNNAPAGAASGFQSQQYWSRAGNNNNNGNNNIFGTLWNSPIYTQTNGVNRMTLMGTNPAGSITGGLGLGTSLPKSYLHLFNYGIGAQDPQGKMFRTEGRLSQDHNWSMYTGVTAVSATEKFRITTLLGGSNVQMGSVSNGFLDLITANITRVHILGNVNVPYYNRSGFVGFNLNAPLFHIDVNTQNPNDGGVRGELIFRGRIEDDPNAYISFLNTSTTGSIFTPTVMGKQSNNPQSAFNTLGSIIDIQDTIINVIPITRFTSARDYDPVATMANPILDMNRTHVVQNRRLFGWNNGPDQLMTMEAKGYLGVGTINPGNRVEINSDFYDTLTGIPLGTFGSGPIVTETTDNGEPGLGGINATGYSGLRFSDLTSKSNPYLMNPGPGVLALDSLGDVIYVHGNGSFGATCSDTINGKLQFDTKVDLNNENFYFTRNDSIGRNRVAVGFDCGDSLIAKFNVFSDREKINSYYYTNDANNIDVSNQQYGVYSFVDSLQSNQAFGVSGQVSQYDNVQRNKAVGVQGIVNTNNVKSPIGVEGISINGGYGGWFTSTGGSNGNSTNGIHVESTGSMSSNTGIFAYSSGSGIPGSNIGTISTAVGNNVANNNYGTYSSAFGSNNSNFGAFGEASGGTFNAGIYGRAPVVANSYAGYFQGSVFVNGTFSSSDQNLKENIQTLDNSDSLLNALNPVAFEFKVSYNYVQSGNASYMHFPSNNQYGLIIPEIVLEATSPSIYDSLGNEIVVSETFKTIDYTKLIPHLIKGHQTQDSIISAQGLLIDSLTNENYSTTNYNDSLEQMISDLNARLTQLENCLSNILPALCNANSMAVQSTPAETQEYLEKAINVTLSNRNNIVLNQNVPNPFAESTVITYSIPSTVQKAQIHFYDGTGKLINSVDITERGNGQLNVFANDLSTGVYTYSLVADGQIVSTKRMMKQ